MHWCAPLVKPSTTKCLSSTGASMTIEKIYSELGQVLFNIAPNLDGPINFVIFLREEKNRLI